MPLQLKHVFAGVGIRGGKIKREAVVYGFAARIEEDRPNGMALRRHFAEQGSRERRDDSTGHPDHTDARTSGRCGDGRNRIIRPGHGLALHETFLET
jgi:hypothetical protein